MAATPKPIRRQMKRAVKTMKKTPFEVLILDKADWLLPENGPGESWEPVLYFDTCCHGYGECFSAGNGEGLGLGDGFGDGSVSTRGFCRGFPNGNGFYNRND